MEEKYTNCIGLTSQFRMCGNPFRADTYRGCEFNCVYCFANNRTGKNFEGKNNFQIGDIKTIQRIFYNAFESDKQFKDINIELLRNRVPIHLGGMSDPFQPIEYTEHITYEFIKINNKYNYPIIISTKTADIPPEYFEILNPAIHAFQISLIGYDDDYIREFEPNTPDAKQRIEFIKLLKSKSFWVSIRIQPLISIVQVIRLIEKTQNIVDYYTIEHLKLTKMNIDIYNAMLPRLKKWIGNEVAYFAMGGKNEIEYELPYEMKLNNIEKIKKITNIKIGCGDNSLHEKSDSLNCCGVDTMPIAFNNWLKYNSMYIAMTGKNDVWYPKCNCNGVFNSGCIIDGFNNVKQYTDKYYYERFGRPEQQKLF